MLGNELRVIDPESITLRESIAASCDQLRQAREEIQALRSRLEQQQESQQIDSLLAAADLPAFALTEAFRQELASTTDLARRRHLIDERQRLIQRAARPAVASRVRRATPSTIDLDFIRTVRGVRSGVLCGQA